MLTMTTATRPPSRWSIMNAGQDHSRLLEMPRAYLETSPRLHLGPSATNIMDGDCGGIPRRVPHYKLPVGDAALRWGFRHQSQHEKEGEKCHPLSRRRMGSPEEVTRVEGQNGRKEGSGWMQPLHSATALFFVLRQFSNVGSQLRPSWPHPSPGTKRRNQLGLVK